MEPPNFPIGQDAQLVLPRVLEYVPWGHGAHSPVDVALENCPSKQALQLL
jgi:hypothetical protein